MKLVGHAAVFNSRSVDLGGFVEVIERGAFARTLLDGQPKFGLHHHDFGQVLASTQAGTLRLDEDRTGLAFEMDLPDTALGKDVHTLVKRGDIRSMSFAFSINGAAGEVWRELAKGLFERTLLDVNLFEVSTVARPAYPAANVAGRTLADTRRRMNAAIVRRELAGRLRAA